jgi:acyl carrier protein
MTESNLTRLKEVFASCLEIPVSRITDSLSQDQVTSWDSLATAMLVPEIEEVFGVSFEVDEIVELTSLRQVIEILSAKGVPF